MGKELRNKCNLCLNRASFFSNFVSNVWRYFPIVRLLSWLNVLTVEQLGNK